MDAKIYCVLKTIQITVFLQENYEAKNFQHITLFFNEDQASQCGEARNGCSFKWKLEISNWSKKIGKNSTFKLVADRKYFLLKNRINKDINYGKK